MEKLCSGGLASSMKDVGKTVKSFPTKHVFTTLLLMLLCMLMPQKGWAAFTYESEEWDFEAAAQTDGAEIKMSSTIYSAIGSPAAYGETMTYGGTTKDISRFAFRNLQGAGWGLRSNNGNNGLFGYEANGRYNLFAICNLHAGDIVTITYSSNSATPISYVSGAHVYKTGSTGQVTNIESGVDHTVAQDGDLIIQHNDYYTYIKKIKIQTLQTEATYSITTNEDTNNNTRSTTFAFTGEGRLSINTIAVPFMNVQFGSSQNGVIVEGLGGDASNPVSHIPDWNGYWHVWFNGDNNNIPAQGTFYKFMPTARGKLQVKGYLSNGNIYLYEVNESTGTFTQIAEGSGSGAGSISVPTGWATLEKGKTYYLCENPTSPAHNAFLLHEFTYTNEFNMALGKVLSNGATGGELASVKGATKLDGWSVKKVSGNINKNSIGPNSVSFANNKLSISGIAYNDESADKAGVIILDLEFDAGDATFVVTIPYSAEKGHKWDFYTNVLEIGQYKTTGSLLQQETDNGEWKYTYRVINNQGVGTHDPMYQNVHDMEGNNADMIWETEGLWFDTPPYKSCLYNEIDVDYQQSYTKNNTTWLGQGYTDRYVGILPGGSFTIPGLKKNDRVLIEMGSGDGSSNEVCFLNITNARDAVGKPIISSDIYKAGGSVWNGINKDYKLRGYYHFIAAADGDMTFTMKDGSMTKIYSIEIYQGDHKYTDDATRVPSVDYDGVTYNANAYQLLNDYKSGAKNAAYQLHYRGKGDGLRNPTVIYKTGNVDTGTDKLWYQKTTSSGGSVNHYILFKSTKGEFGMFRMRIDVMEQGNKYVADYGLQNISVGYLDKKAYPYTWDFTDLSSYSSERIAGVIESSTAYNQKVTASTKYDDTSDANDADGDMSEFMNRVSPNETEATYFNAVELWKEYSDKYGTGYGLHLRNNHYDSDQTKHEGSGELMFAPGTQLFAGDSFIAEAVGIGIGQQGDENKRNGRLRITSDGLYLYEQSNSYWKLTIPEVPSTSAVYMRVKPIPERKNDMKVYVGVANSNPDYAQKLDNGECVYAVKGTGADMVLLVANAIVQKIAVSEYAKTVNKLGYATESRAKEIDPELMGYMTGTGLKAYTVTNVTYGNKAGDVPSITLTEIPSANVMGPAGTNDHRGYIIYNTGDTKEVNILDNGFHLFVPDMHDISSASNHKKSILETETEEGKNYLRSHTNSGNISQTEKIGGVEYTNYLMNYKYIGPDNKQHEGPEAFYRASSTATLGNNKAYLQLLTEKVKPSEANGNSGAKFAIIFVDEEQGTETTSLDGVKSVEMLGDNAIYTLSGVKVSKPEKGGIYVKNGKKFIVK